MKTKRNKFLTFIFSLIPGAGHMFMGFMKKGVSLMAAFTIVVFLASWLNISPLLFLLPLLWFYSFFDCINIGYSSDEVFADLEDKYLFTIDTLFSSRARFSRKAGLAAGFALLLIGGYMVWNNIMSGLYNGRIINDWELYRQIRNFGDLFPQIIIGIAIVIIGIKLVMGKRKESGYDA